MMNITKFSIMDNRIAHTNNEKQKLTQTFDIKSELPFRYLEQNATNDWMTKPKTKTK